MFSGVEDDDLFSPAVSSNLASLFGTSMTLKQDADASLTYTAPKQPKQGGQETPKSSPKSAVHSAVVCSKFVDVFKLLEKHHVSQGKCGLAIIGSETLKTYEVIIYKSKQDIIMRTKLRSNFVFTIQSNDFAHFCDDQNQQWSVHFENLQEVNFFIKELETYGARIVYNNNSVDKVGPNIETNPENIVSSTVVKDKDSDSYSDTSSTQTKANILSRMAKMGQSILPTNLPKQSSGLSDSETDEQESNRKSVKRRQKCVTVKGEHTSTDQSLNIQTSPIPEFVMINGQIVPVKQTLPSPFSNISQNQLVQNIPNQVMFGPPQMPAIPDAMNIFVAENRTHNCEVRMNMTQLSFKLDKILEKLDKSECTTSVEADELNQLRLKLAKELEKNKILTEHIEQQPYNIHETSESDKKLIEDLKLQIEDQGKVICDQKQKIQELEYQTRVLQDQNAQNEKLQQQIEEHNQTVTSLKQIINEQRTALEKCYEENKENENLSVLNKELNDNIVNLRDQLADKQVKANLFGKKLKRSINVLYQQIMENFDDEEATFQNTQIKQILLQNLKSSTITIIREFEKDFQNAEINPHTENSDLASSVS